MKFLVDTVLSPVVAARLQEAGHDAIHVRARNLHAAPDEEVLDFAAAEQRVLVSAGTDFTALLALREARSPSFILFRGSANRRPELQSNLILDNLSAIESDLEQGCVVSIEASRMRIRRLPLLGP